MFRSVLVGLVAAIAVGCTGASAASSDRPPPTLVIIRNESKIQSSTAPDRLICRSIREVGSHIYRKRCRTQRQIDTEMNDIQNEILLSLYKVGKL